MHGTISLPASPALPRCAHIIALDLGKFNSVLCRLDPATAAHWFVSLTTTPEAIIRELDPVPVADRITTLVVFETCDISGWVYDLVSPMGFQVAIATAWVNETTRQSTTRG